VENLPLRRLLTGPSPAPSRIFFTSIWFKGHNNPRYAELLPRLERLDRYLVTCSDERIVRGLQYRAYRWTQLVRNPVVMRTAGRRYRSLFTADNEQIADFPGTVVSDVDDPRFTEREVELLNQPNVAAYVVTAERAARRFESLGVAKPYHVVPQGVSLTTATPELISEIGKERKSPGTVIVGYLSALMLTADDRDGDKALYNVDHLLDLWDEVRLRAPQARLWLVGGASDRVLRRIGSRDDIVAFGRLERHLALAHTANFDIALYPREKDEGIQAAKTAEYMGLGVPTVSYDYAVTEELRETGAGILVGDSRSFVDAVVHLIEDSAARRAMAAAAAAAGVERSWDALAAKYQTEILDRYLP
jgi:glycosyltransferase involved in cell wall biosynthesis